MISPSCSSKNLGFSMVISDENDAQSYTISVHLWFAPKALILVLYRPQIYPVMVVKSDRYARLWRAIQEAIDVTTSTPAACVPII